MSDVQGESEWDLQSADAGAAEGEGVGHGLPMLDPPEAPEAPDALDAADDGDLEAADGSEATGADDSGDPDDLQDVADWDRESADVPSPEADGLG